MNKEKKAAEYYFMQKLNQKMGMEHNLSGALEDCQTLGILDQNGNPAKGANPETIKFMQELFREYD